MDQQKQFDILLTALHTIAENVSLTNYEIAQEALDKINELEYVFQDKDFPDDPDKLVKMSLEELQIHFYASNEYKLFKEGEMSIFKLESAFNGFVYSIGIPNFNIRAVLGKVAMVENRNLTKL